MSLLRACILSLLGTSAILGSEFHISTVDQFLTFTNNVNEGCTYSGTTVYLDSDIAFDSDSSTKFIPIGIDSNKNFNSIFNGQGYVIRNLALTVSSYDYLGIFGNSLGATIENLIVDSTCSMRNTRYNNNTIVEAGSVLATCTATYSKCTIENVVNMAPVTFAGTTNNIKMGGLCGQINAKSYEMYIKNCVNYGAVTHSGSVSSYVHLGGIVGDSDNGKKAFYNCLNHGNVAFSSSTSTAHIWIGGIIGETVKGTVTFHNCVNAGVLSKTMPHGDVGNIGGCITTSATFSYVYWDSETGYNSTCGSVSSHTLKDYGTLTSSNYDSVISALNTQATANSWNGWMYNPNERNANFSINERSGFVLSSKIIIYPNLAACGSFKFAGWYKDLSNYQIDMPTKITVDTTKYSFYGTAIVTITFNANSGSVSQESKYGVYNTKYSELPTPTRSYYTFDGWYTASSGGNKVTSTTIITTKSDHTLYAHWIGIELTVTFNANKGDSVSQESKIVNYNSSYGALPTATRTGYTLVGWYTDASDGTEINETTNVGFTSNQTLYAHWIPNSYTVTFDVNGGNELSGGEESMMFIFNTTYNSLPEPSREGYSFSLWNSEKNGRGINITKDIRVEIANDHTLYAQWIINQYVLKFLFNNNSGPEVRILDFNSLIDYPKDVTREGYRFNGWNDSISFMPAKDVTITAQWTSGISSLAVFAIIISILVFIFIIIIIIVVIFAFFKKNDDNNRRFELEKPLIDEKDINADDYFRIVSLNTDDLENGITTGNTRSILTSLYPKDYVRPTMRDALLKAELPKERVELICSACMTISNNKIDEKTSAEGFTEEDALSIFMYTYDFGPREYEHNPYRVINRSLVERNYAALQKISGMLYLVMTALRKLPRVTGKTLYRGVKGEVNLDKSHYCEGNIITWMALSSTSPDMKATKAFLDKGSKGMKAVGTLFIIENGWGYDIQPYSMFPNEAEILIEPERQFKVTGVIEADLTIINLVMLDTPLSVPETFG